MRLISLEKSNKPNKKLVIKFSDPNLTIHFGSKYSSTYLDHHDKVKRTYYLKRHKVNEDWGNPISRGALSMWLLWGSTTDLKTNLLNYIDLFDISY